VKTARHSQLSTLNSPFKQTEVGMIPEEWCIAKFTEVTTLITCGLAATPKYVSERSGYPFLSSMNVKNGRVLWSNFKYISHDLHKKLYSNNPPQKGDILYSRVGTIGEAAVIEEDFEFSIYVSLTLIKPGRVIDRYYLMHLLNSGPYRRRALDQVYLGSGVGNLNVEVVRNYPIVFPPTKAEQEAIAEVLSDADALIESLEQLIAKKRQIKQGTMQELLRPKDGWVEKRLGNTTVLKARIGWQGLTTAEYLDSGDFYLVTGTDFKDGYVDWSNCHYVDESRYKQDKNIQLRVHDVLVTKDGTIGKVALVNHLDKPATLNSGVFVIRPIEDAFHPEFFYCLLCSNVFAEFLGQLSAGSTINHLYQKDFVNFIYKAPARITEQEAVSTILSEMDAEIAVLEKKLAKARQIKQGMMQELLTGKTRLVNSGKWKVENEK
jgi:type I restriction enzyme S subunit